MAEDNIINNLYKFRIVSLNVRGLRDYKKRRKVYNWASKQDGQNGITFLQEAHCDQVSESKWRNQYFSHGKSNSCGVITLIGSNLEYKLIKKIIDEMGGLLSFIVLSKDRNSY